jgi:Zn-dependent metalloprotease
MLVSLTASVVQGAPPSGKGILGRIADSILGDKNAPGVLKPILEDAAATMALGYELSSAIDAQMVDVSYSKLKFNWTPRELDKDASIARFDSGNVMRFKLDTDAIVNRSSFFQIYKDDLKLTDDDQILMLNVKDQVVTTTTGSKTYTHSKFKQLYKGVPVMGAQYTMLEQGGKLRSGSGHLAAGINLDVNPTVDMDAARNYALAEIGAELYSWQSSPCLPGGATCVFAGVPSQEAWYCTEVVNDSCQAIDNAPYTWLCIGDIGELPVGEIDEPFPGYCGEPQGNLAIFSKGWTMKPGSYALVWNFRIYSATPATIYDVMVDAHTGQVLFAVDARVDDVLPALDLAEDAQCSGETLYNGLQQFRASYIPSPTDAYTLFQKYDASVPRPKISLKTRWANQTFPPPEPDSDNVHDDFWTPNSGSCFFGQGEDLLGASVWWGAMGVQDYYAQNFNWYGLDGIGKRQVRMFLDHTPGGTSGTYALLDWAKDQDEWESVAWFVFNAVQDDLSSEQVNLSAIAHEYAHGVTMGMVEKMARPFKAEFHILMEGIAMALSVTAEAYVLNRPIDWCYGEERRFDGACIVEYSDPKVYHDPDTYEGEYWRDIYVDADGNSVDQCHGPTTNDWCHINSSVFGRWFYLMANGGSGVNDNGYEYDVLGVGPDIAASILLQTMKYHMTPLETFYDMSEHTREAAIELYVKQLPETKADFAENHPVVRAVVDAWAAVGVGQPMDTTFFSPKNGDPDVLAWPVEFTWEAAVGSNERLLVSMSKDFDKSFVVTPQQDTPLLADMDGNTAQTTVMRKAEVNLRPDKTYYWRVVTEVATAPVETGSFNKGFALIPWLKDIVGINDDPSTQLSSDYVVTPEYPGWAKSPIRYFKTSKMKPEIIQPSGANPAHPWDAKFVTSSVPGAISIVVGLTDLETNQYEAIIKSADSVLEQSDNTYVVHKDLKVDHHYKVMAYAVGPQIADGVNLPSNFGRLSKEREFWTSRPKVDLYTPTEGQEVLPSAYFQWGKLQGVDAALGNGAHYKLVVSRSQELTEPFAAEADNLLAAESLLDLPPADASGQPAEYYWSVLPVGPTAYGETGEYAQPIRFKVDGSATQPVGLFPSYNSSFSDIAYGSTYFEFGFMPAPGAESYIVDVTRANGEHVITIPAPMSAISDFMPVRMSFPPSRVLSDDEVRLMTTDLNGYCWTIRGVFNGNPGLNSEPLCYGVSTSNPTIISPKGGVTVTKEENGKVPLMWDAEYAPYGYGLVFWKGQSCSGDYDIRYDITDGSVHAFEALQEVKDDAAFAWRVCAFKSSERVQCKFSSCANFNVIVKKPEEPEDPDDPEQQCSALYAPTILQPAPPTGSTPAEIAASAQVYLNSPVTAQWTTVPGATSYYWTLSVGMSVIQGYDSTLDQIADGQALGGSTLLIIYDWLVSAGYSYPNLAMDGDGYIFTVQAVNACGDMSPAAMTGFFLDAY